MAAEDEIVRRLDKVVAILQIVHADTIDQTRARIRGDAACNAILNATDDWTGAATVRAAASMVGSARSTTSKKIVELIDRGMLEKRGAGKAIEYRSTGLV